MRVAAVTTVCVVVTAAACSSRSPLSGIGDPGRSSPCTAAFEWDISRSWRLITLDDLARVRRGDTLEIRAKPYKPMTSEVTVTGSRNAPSRSEVLTALRERTRTPLAAPGTSTARLARKAEVTFRAKGAEAVYFQGLEAVTATYRYRCTADGAGADRGTGHVATWDPRSLTVGLIDCLAPARDNPDSEPAELALKLRCPGDSPAVRTS
ncbi:hypothetical protein OHT57_32600 [Streptomyces sp. NBC_00285]|uniref:hypothetical protein n=1 Tax=Streptomyces sp. NBC_00285 TaxID=2975700 RepID=UPI002E2BD092|nr:hypothetical protein [Streptomyces sp. NBC_00285]